MTRPLFAEVLPVVTVLAALATAVPAQQCSRGPAGGARASWTGT